MCIWIYKKNTLLRLKNHNTCIKFNLKRYHNSNQRREAASCKKNIDDNKRDCRDQPSNRLDSYISLLRQKIEKRAISFDSDTKLFVLENATFLILLRIFDETLKHRRGSASLSKTVKKSNIGYAEIGGCSANLKFE